LVRFFFSSTGFASAAGTGRAGGNPKLKLGKGYGYPKIGGGLPNIFFFIS
jgi:hypothetical protein